MKVEITKKVYEKYFKSYIKYQLKFYKKKEVKSFFTKITLTDELKILILKGKI